MKEFEFIEEMIKNTKKEIKERKQWQKALQHELNLERTYKYHQEDKIRRMIIISRVMIRHYENILKEQEAMLEEVKEIR